MRQFDYLDAAQAGMLARARAAGGYDELHQKDLMAALNSHASQAVDLLVAADVLIYVHQLDKVFAEAQRVLQDGGLFVFSTEAAGEEESSEALGTQTQGHLGMSSP